MKVLNGTLHIPQIDTADGQEFHRPETAEQMQQLVLQWSPLVWKIANKVYRTSGPRWGMVEDFFQQGILTLIKCIEMFDPAKGTKFITYAQASIYRNLRRECLSGVIKVPGQTAAKNEQLDDAFDTAYRQAHRALHVSSLSNSRNFLEPSWDSIPDKYLKDAINSLQEALHSLQEREQEVLKERFENGATLQQIGDSYGFSRERARQLEARAIAKIRNWLMEGDVEEQIARSRIFNTNHIDSTTDAVAHAPEDSDAS